MKILKVVLVLQVIALILICVFQGRNGLSRRSTGDFETGTAGWKVLDGSISSVTRETAAACVHEGKGSLRFDYEWKQGKIPICGNQKAGLEGKKAIRLWIKSKEATAVAVVVRDKRNMNYYYPVAIGQQDTWKEVAFNFSEMKAEKESPQGGLDTQDASLGFIDFLTIAAKKEGKKTLWIDSVILYDQELPGPGMPGSRGDDLGQWLPVAPGLSSIKIIPQSPGLTEAAETLEFEYTLEPGAIVAMARIGFEPGNNASIRFQVKTSEPSELVLALEEKKGGRYIYTFTTGENRWQKVHVTLDQFTLAPDSRDDNTIMDRDRLNGTLCLADMDNFLCLKTGSQKLWLNNFRIE